MLSLAHFTFHEPSLLLLSPFPCFILRLQLGNPAVWWTGFYCFVSLRSMSGLVCMLFKMYRMLLTKSLGFLLCEHQLLQTIDVAVCPLNLSFPVAA